MKIEFTFSKALFFIVLAVGVEKLKLHLFDMVNGVKDFDILEDLVPRFSCYVIGAIDLGLIYL